MYFFLVQGNVFFKLHPLPIAYTCMGRRPACVVTLLPLWNCESNLGQPEVWVNQKFPWSAKNAADTDVSLQLVRGTKMRVNEFLSSVDGVQERCQTVKATTWNGRYFYARFGSNPNLHWNGQAYTVSRALLGLRAQFIVILFHVFRSKTSSVTQFKHWSLIKIICQPESGTKKDLHGNMIIQQLWLTLLNFTEKSRFHSWC